MQNTTLHKKDDNKRQSRKLFLHNNNIKRKKERLSFELLPVTQHKAVKPTSSWLNNYKKKLNILVNLLNYYYLYKIYNI
jgi:hypothetical protein